MIDDVQLPLPVTLAELATTLRLDFAVDYRVVDDDGGLVEFLRGGEVVFTVLATDDRSADLLRAREQLAQLSAFGCERPTRAGAHRRSVGAMSLRRAADVLLEAAALATTGRVDLLPQYTHRADALVTQGVRLLGGHRG